MKYQPPLSDVIVTVKKVPSSAKGKSGETSCDSFAEVQLADNSIGGYVVILKEPGADEGDHDGTQFLNVGRYKIALAFKESRQGIVSSFPQERRDIMSEVRHDVDLTVSPGSACDMCLSAPSLKSLAHAVASNAKDASSTRRNVAKKIELLPQDRFENNTVWPEGMVVTCHLERRNINSSSSSSTEISSTLPVLVGSDGDGRLFATMSADRTTATFSSLDLVQEEGQGEGTITIVFRARSIGDTGETEMEDDAGHRQFHCEATFNFVTDEGRIRAVNEILAQLTPLEQEVENYNREVRENTSNLAKAKNDLTLVLKNANRQSVCLCADDDDLTCNTVSQLVANLRHDLGRLMTNPENRTTERRAPVKKKEISAASLVRLGDKVLGMVVDLATVNTYTDAFLLSWAAKGYMDVFVCTDDETGKAIYAENFRSWPINMITKFAIVTANGRRQRTNAEMASRKLPLTTLSLDRGNPEYMVNMLHLSPEHEHLRDNVFWNIYKQTVVVDTMDDAIALRKIMVAKNTSSAIFTRRGERLGFDGVMDPGKDSKLPKELPFVYGGPPPQKSGEVVAIEQDLATLGAATELIKMKEALTRKNAELQALAAERREDEVKIEDLKRQLGEFGL
jgi:hypothetical protein